MDKNSYEFSTSTGKEGGEENNTDEQENDGEVFISKNLLNEIPPQSDQIIKLVLIGESGVGKSLIISQWFTGKYKDTIPTLNVEFHTKYYKINEKTVSVQVWDTVGQERFHSLTKNYYRGSMGAIIVFDITDRTSFDRLDYWIDDLREVCSQEIKILIVGNKSDLNEKRQVPTELALNFAQSKELFFLEVSALTGSNVKKAFSNILNDIYKKIQLVQKFEQEKLEEERKQTIIITPEDLISDHQQPEGCICG